MQGQLSSAAHHSSELLLWCWGGWKVGGNWSIKKCCAPSRFQHLRSRKRRRKIMSTSTITKGLEGVVAASSGVCYIDGEAGVLAYRGIDIHELAEKSNFEETCYLLWFGKLPKAAELADLKQKLAAERKMDPAIYDLMRQVPKTATPMEVLRTAVSALSFYDKEAEAIDHDANVRKAIRLTSQIAMLVAGYDRIRKGKNIIDPDSSLSHAANFLLQLNGEKPTP